MRALINGFCLTPFPYKNGDIYGGSPKIVRTFIVYTGPLCGTMAVVILVKNWPETAEVSFKDTKERCAARSNIFFKAEFLLSSLKILTLYCP